VQIFTSEGEAMQALILRYLAEARGRPGEEERIHQLNYLNLLAKAFGSPENKAIPASIEVKNIIASNACLLEPLSLRESEVLTLLLAGKSIKEIAGEMAIAPNTVRAHVRTLHRKLGVHSRLGIYQRAKELNLIG
jgi:LuxR family maltose regulon positive regulatory protein